MNLKLISAMALGASMLIGCSDDVTKTQGSNTVVDANVRSHGDIVLTLQNKATGAPLKGGFAVRAGTIDTLRVDSTGSVKFLNVQAGTQTFYIADSAKSIVPVYYTVNAQWHDVGTSNDSKSVPIVEDIAKKIELVSSGAIVRGRAVATNAKGVQSVVSGASVTLTLADAGGVSFVSKVFTASTDADGYYSFTVPAQTSYTLTFADKDGLTAAPISATSPVFGASNLSTTVAQYQVQALDLAVLANPTLLTIKPADAIEVTFNQAIDTSMVYFNYGSVSVGSTAITYSFSNGNKTVKVVPVGGTWATGTKTLSIKAYSAAKLSMIDTDIDYTVLSANLSAVNDIFLTAIDGVALATATKIVGTQALGKDSNAVNVAIKSALPTNANKAVIYKKMSTDADYSQYSSSNPTDTLISTISIDVNAAVTTSYFIRYLNTTTNEKVDSPIFTFTK